jgi:hypothetical protein
MGAPELRPFEERTAPQNHPGHKRPASEGRPYRKKSEAVLGDNLLGVFVDEGEGGALVAEKEV